MKQKTKKLFSWPSVAQHLRDHYLFYLLLIFFSFLFFFRLDYSTLTSWDEGWYASIAREMTRTGDFMHSMWNGKPFFDHPPFGFWMMALSYKLFGFTEFAVRFPSAILGVLSILLVYLIGKDFFKNKYIGFVAALILGTSVWYVIRARSGNLDSPFVFFYILTVYLSVRSSRDFRWFPFVMLSFGALVMTKTLIGVSVSVLIVYLNFRQFFRLKNIPWLALGAAVFALVVYPWYHEQLKTYSDFYQQHFINTGMRRKTFASFFHLMPEKPIFYIHMGIRKWYYLWLLAVGYVVVRSLVVGGMFMAHFFGKKNKNITKTLEFLGDTKLEVWYRVVFFLIWNTVVLYPFLTAEQTELWHLIPNYVPIAFLIAFAFCEGLSIAFHLVEITLPKLKKVPPRIKELIKDKRVATVFYVMPFVFFALLQFKVFYKEVFPAARYVPEDVDIAKRLGKYKQTILLDDDFIPIAVFYAGRPVRQLAYEDGDKHTLVGFFKSDEKDFAIAVRWWAVQHLDKEKIPYKIVEKNSIFSIITRP